MNQKTLVLSAVVAAILALGVTTLVQQVSSQSDYGNSDGATNERTTNIEVTSIASCDKDNTPQSDTENMPQTDQQDTNTCRQASKATYPH